MADQILSAALYFDPRSARSVTAEVLDTAVTLLTPSQIPIREFEISGASLFPKPVVYPFPPKSWKRLQTALVTQHPTSFALYAHATKTDLPMSWQASVGIDWKAGYVFLGALLDCLRGARAVLEEALPLCRLIAPCRYGIAFVRSERLDPAGYAHGIVGGFSETLQIDDATSLRIGQWNRELRTSRRYLRGWFRSVYPAQLLSEQHREAPLTDGREVADCGLGTWEEVEEALWCWELSEEELPKAHELLSEAGLLLGA